ncbi:MAG: hypothetical protein OQJ96_03155 [Flavobacteriales bacterium]|nr:hypothetical protein [Flavobacteriales bacterium]MCW8912354.1 hypothetical protein [Flavobacteriales bacterium]MCW8938573.1 hypothetical protein [Flavobacteriales bacterium]MCW8967504.1 hypothetical protein [Flavobacteriales bacterium]MCW8989493.1 hypothetical protein [Flavobacteriales bacterium]
MKLEKILDNLNSFEKNSFLKIIDNILSENPKNIKAVDNILNDTSRDLKNIDNINVAKVFNLLKDEFSECVKEEFVKTTSQLDILIDIISRDGNSIMKQDWLARLYEKELSNLNKKIKLFKSSLEDEKSELSDQRIRDYKIYRACLNKAYTNDDDNNQERKITTDEQGILLTLSQQLTLSQEELKLINYTIVPLKKLDIDTVINELKTIGVIFYSKKTSTIYVADEMVRLLRKLRGKEVADKFFRRVLRLLREPQINLICRNHNLDWKLDLDEKIHQIISGGILFSGVLMEDIYKPGTNLTEKKKTINTLCDKGLKITPALKGTLIEEKVQNLITYFEDIEKDDKVGISVDGYEKLLVEIGEFLPKLNNILRNEFELQEENVLKSNYLLDYNIKPRDILELVTEKQLEDFCKAKEIKTRGDIILNILDAYKDSENLYLENYENIGFRNLLKLKENGIIIKEADLGVKFEELTKNIFIGLGFNVDEQLRKSINTSKDKIDILLNIGNNDLILVECKTVKESGYNKFSSVSRQLKAYSNLGNSKGYRVIKSLLIAPDFSDEFIKDCGLEYELNLSLITASTLIKVLHGFKESKMKVFPHNLLMRDVLIQEDRVLKAIGK